MNEDHDLFFYKITLAVLWKMFGTWPQAGMTVKKQLQ